METIGEYLGGTIQENTLKHVMDPHLDSMLTAMHENTVRRVSNEKGSQIFDRACKELNICFDAGSVKKPDKKFIKLFDRMVEREINTMFNIELVAMYSRDEISKCSMNNYWLYE